MSKKVEEPKKIEAYEFNSEDRAVLKFLVSERNVANERAMIATEQVQRFLNKVAMDNGLGQTCPYFDDKNISGLYPTKKECDEAGKQ
jgi:hypothetical protein